MAKKQALIFDFAKTLQTQNNFKLNLNLPFLQACVSISAVLKTKYYYGNKSKFSGFIKKPNENK